MGQTKQQLSECAREHCGTAKKAVITEEGAMFGREHVSWRKEVEDVRFFTVSDGGAERMGKTMGQTEQRLSEWIWRLERASEYFWKAKKAILMKDEAKFNRYHTSAVMEVKEALFSMRRTAEKGGNSGIDDKYITGAPETLSEEEINDYIEKFVREGGLKNVSEGHDD